MSLGSHNSSKSRSVAKINSIEYDLDVLSLADLKRKAVELGYELKELKGKSAAAIRELIIGAIEAVRTAVSLILTAFLLTL